MERKGRSERGTTSRRILRVAGMTAAMLVMACSARFKPGDPVGLPPLPPSDNLLGFFSKFKVPDNSGLTYGVRDLPPTMRPDAPAVWDPARYRAGQPSVIAYQNELLLFFLLFDADPVNGVTSSVKVGKLEPASPYITSGANGISESGLGHDDVQVRTVDSIGLTPMTIVVAPGKDSVLQTIVPRGSDDQIVEAVVPGINGGLSTAPVDDDEIAQTVYILPGPDGVLDSVAGINGDDLASVVIVAGSDGAAQSGTGGTDIVSSLFQVGNKYYTRSGIPSGFGEPNRLAVSAGVDNRINTPCVFDDNRIRSSSNNKMELVTMTNGIYSGDDGVVRSGLGGDDIQVRRAYTTVTPFDLLVLPGADNLLETFARGVTDMQTFTAGSLPTLPADAVIYGGPDGVLDVCPAGDDEVGVSASINMPNTFITAGANNIVDTSVNGDDMFAALDGGNGVAESGLGGDDVQVLSAGINIFPGIALPLVGAGANGILDTPVRGDDMVAIYNFGWAPTGFTVDACNTTVSATESLCALAESGIGGDDIQVIVGGVSGLNPTDVVVTDGGNASLETLALGDDVVSGTDILAGPNGVAESGTWADDVQVARRGVASLLRLDLSPPAGFDQADPVLPFPVILPGPNGVIETPVSGNDSLAIFEPGLGNDGFIELLIMFLYLVDSNGNAIPDELPEGNSEVESGLGGTGVLDAILGCSSTGLLDNGGSINIDNPYINNPASGTCRPRMDDVQLLPIAGVCTSPDQPIIWAGADNVLQTAPNLASDDYIGTDGKFVRCGADLSVSSMVIAYCPDDCQEITEGATAGSNDVLIIAGPNRIFDTPLLGDDDDRLGIVDGGNGIAESGIGGDDAQVIPAGSGLPNTIAVIAGPSVDGAPRTLYTYPGGDDQILDPGAIYPVLAADGIFTNENQLTDPDPDGNKRVENYATVNDGEYFSWQDTNIDATFLTPFLGQTAGGDVVDDLQIIASGTSCFLGQTVVMAGPNGLLETVPMYDESVTAAGDEILCGSTGTAHAQVDRSAVLSFRVIPNLADPAQLIGYMSNGKEIFITRSTDGITWDGPQSVLTAGGVGRAEDPVVMAGMDGICETIAQGDDVQIIQPGYAIPNRPAISAGPNKTVQSVPMGDDFLYGLFIWTGANGIRETPLVGDDWENIPFGQGEPDSACITAGANGRRDTSDATIGASPCSVNPSNSTIRYCSTDFDESVSLPDNVIGDDRPPFLDRNGNLTDDNRNSAKYNPNCNPLAAANYGQECPWRAESNETGIGDGGWAGFDALGVNDPNVYVWEGVYYMYYTGTGAEIEPLGERPTAAATEVLGACTRMGINGQLRGSPLYDTKNLDNNGSVVVANRIGLATSTDGVNWTKYPGPVLGLSNVCGSASDLSLVAGLIGDIGIALIIPGASAFDYTGVSGPNVSATYAADGSTVFAMMYDGLAENYTALDGDTGRAVLKGTKSGIGLARSFDGVNWTKMDDFSPVFVGGGLGGLLGGGAVVEESNQTIQQIPDAYMMFFDEGNFTIDTDNYPTEITSAVSIALRYGAVYGSCLSVAASPFSGEKNSGAAVAFGAIILLPGIFLIGRRMIVRRRRKQA